MTKTIQDIILKWIGEDRYFVERESDEFDAGYNQALADLREKAPELAKEIEVVMTKENGMECEHCGLIKPDVCHRSDPYERDIENDPSAMHTSCDECDYQRAMDI